MRVVLMLAFAGCATEDEVECLEVEDVVANDGCADAAECCTRDPGGRVSGDCWWEIEDGEILVCEGEDCAKAVNAWTTDYCELPKRQEPPPR